MVRVLVAILIIFGALFSIYFSIFGLDRSFAENVFISLISSTIMLVPTILILEQLIKNHNARMTKRNEKKRYKEVLSTRHEILVKNLETAYVHYVTKKPANMYLKQEDFVKIVNNLDQYIDETFLKEKYKMVTIGPDGLFDFRDINIKYQDFFVSQFRDNIYKLFNEYVGRYVSFIPEDILKSVFKIEDTLKNDAFTVPNDFAGVELDISNANFNPDTFIEPIKVIGEEIIKLREYQGD